jgi:molecular chaperone GrpE (heat shock protein)
MKEISEWKVAKWPFIIAWIILLVVACGVVIEAAHPISLWEMAAAIACVAFGAWLGCLPFILEYRATVKLLDANALTTVTEQLQNLKAYSAQIATATDQWARVQEVTKGSAEKTLAAANEISERMAGEVREFNEFQKKMNDVEKGALRLEVEKLRRTEGEWLQVVARILDHIFALHTAAARAGQPELTEQISHFQNACRDAARRVGVAPFAIEPGEPFDAERQRVHGVEKPPATAVVAETLAPGLTFQGRLIRPALVRLREPATPVAAPAPPAEENELTLGAD